MKCSYRFACRFAWMNVLFILLAVFALCGPVSAAKQGGTLRVVIDADPPTLDPHASTTTLTFVVGYHMFEGLYALNDQMQPVPMLAAAMPTLSADQKTYTIPLRKGLKFHNGQPVTAKDAIASLKRWGGMNKYGKAVFKYVESLEAKDDHTIVMTLTQPVGSTLVSIAMPNGGAFVYPAELCEKYASKPMAEYVGTGPFQFVEWRPNHNISMKRFDGYQPASFDATGYGGKKVAYVDELVFYGIPDEMVRVNGVEGGEYDFSDFIPVDEYDRLKDSDTLNAMPSMPRAWFAFNFNKRAGIMSNRTMRQAFQAAMDVDSIMEGGYGNRDFWRLDPSLMFKEQAWYSTVGKENYSQNNIAKAKELLKKAGYKGEKIVWMSGPLEYNLSLVAKSQLEKAGFNIDLQTMEWATLSNRRKNPELWDVFSTGMTLKPDPTMFTALNPKYAGWWEAPRFLELRDQLTQESDFDKRYKIMEQIQEFFYEDVPTIRLGDYSNLRIAGKNVKGFGKMPEIFFWNVWKE